MNTHTVYFRNIIKAMAKKWWLTLLFMLVFAAVFVFAAFKSADAAKELSEEQQKEVEVYQEKCDAYEESIADYKESVNSELEVVNKLKDYCENSIYMQIDPTDVKVASASIFIETTNDNSLQNIMNALVQFINTSIPQYFEEQYPDSLVQYWPDLIKKSYSRNSFVINVRHYDMDQAILIRDAVVDAISANLGTISQQAGEFAIISTDTKNYTTSVAEILTDQASQQEKLASAQKSLASYRASLRSQQTGYKEYKKNSEPEALKTVQLTKTTLVKNGAFGAVTGFVILFALIFLYFLFSSKIRGRQEIEECGANVLGRVKANGEFLPSAERVVMDAELMLEGKEGVFISILSGSTLAKKTADKLIEAFEKSGIKAVSGTSGLDDISELKKMRALGTVIIITEAGVTRYEQVEKQVDICRRFKAELVGCMELS